ncbi:hypothetical protein BS47DRAFT_1482812 [Hydnum rufescens UP504]|uniref:Uncharacterized protein n=1 Tax=Hydnum rufescens UP504 TaxID=1448309 RepID=A0A9P6E0M6_9AGAM|nr:hypothetical protein BS47DRAFT_1482812 [Hydnum rufescens UP504]
MSCAASRISKSPVRTPIDEPDPWQSPRPGTTSIPPKRPYMFWVQGQSPPKHPTKYSTSPTRHNGNRKFPEKDTGYGFMSTGKVASRGFPKEQVLPDTVLMSRTTAQFVQTVTGSVMVERLN